MPGSVPFYWVDAFTERAFGGNPAGVCPLEEWLPDSLMQRMAMQHGLSETAFFVRKGGERYHLRWYTPAVEVDLCGHATLAAGHVLFNEIGCSGAALTFDSRSGPLTVRRSQGRLSLDFPVRPSARVEAPRELAAGLGAAPTEVGLTQTMWLAVFPKAEDVRGLSPDFSLLSKVRPGRVIVTAPGDEEGVDFVSRFFAPDAGILEDPVTGSAHCVLAPYWGGRLGKGGLHAKQVSRRGGELWCTLAGDRVHIAGSAVTYLRGRVEAGIAS